MVLCPLEKLAPTLKLITVLSSEHVYATFGTITAQGLWPSRCRPIHHQTNFDANKRANRNLPPAYLSE